jgi:hypothetical protein
MHLYPSVEARSCVHLIRVDQRLLGGSLSAVSESVPRVRMETTYQHTPGRSWLAT